MKNPRTTAYIGIMLIIMLKASTASGQTITGKWVESSSLGNPLFIVTFSDDGTYRAECRDEAFCSLCAGGGPVVETGTYTITDNVATIKITASNAPNSSLRINMPFQVEFTRASSNALTLANAPVLSFNWAESPSLNFTLTITGVEYTTWRAVKELFK